MTIPEHVIEAAMTASREVRWKLIQEKTGQRYASVEEAEEAIQEQARQILTAGIEAAFASLWQPIESAETQDWSSDSWTLPVKVATDDEGNPLFLVYYESKDSGYWRATKWMPLPLPKGSE